MGAEQVELTGGETYLRSDWLELVRSVREAGLRCAMITAGLHIDMEQARRAAEAGLHHVSVSIDGPLATHDELRGVSGSFESALRAVECFRAAGIPTACNTQVNARNWQELPALADILSGLGLYAWQVQLMIPMGRAVEAPNLWFQPYQMLEVVPAVAALIERCSARGLTVFAGDNVGYFGPHEQTLRRGVNRQGHTVGCSAGALALGVDPFGGVKGCSSLDGADQIAGNVRDRALADLWFESPILHATEDWSPDSLWGFCATCYYAAVCRGGCSATAIALTGRRGNNPYCHHRALELAQRGLRETLVPLVPLVPLAPLATASHGRRGFAVFELRVGPVQGAAAHP